MFTYGLAFLLGAVTGLRSMVGFAAICWAASLGKLYVANTWLEFLSYSATPYIASLLALAEIVNDKLPKTPSRKAAGPFGVRIVIGALGGYAIAGSSIVGLIAGALGAFAGTLAGYELRMKMAKAFGKDLPAALIEDALAVAVAFWIVTG